MTGAVIWHIVIVSSLPPIQKDEVYLNLVLDFVPETVYRVARHFNKAKSIIPIIYVKVNSLPSFFFHSPTFACLNVFSLDFDCLV